MSPLWSLLPQFSMSCWQEARRGKPHSGLESIPAIQYYTGSSTLDDQFLSVLNGYAIFIELCVGGIK